MNLAPTVAYKVMLGAALFGGAAGLAGTFAVLRRRALVGDMLSHAALPGVCTVFLLTGHRESHWLALGALGAGILAIATLAGLTRWSTVREDAALGIVLSTFFGVGVVLLSYAQKSPLGTQAGLASYLFGEIAGIQKSELLLLAIVGALVSGSTFPFFKELKLITFDQDFASAQGWPTTRIDLAILAGVAIVAVVGLPICGVILTAAMLMIPCAAARFWSDRLSVVTLIAASVGALAGGGGTWLASPLPQAWFGFDFLSLSTQRQPMPPGPLVVLAAATIFLFSLFFAPRRGIVPRAISEVRLRLRMQREHFLRSFYELSESELPAMRRVTLDELVKHRNWSPAQMQWWAGWARRQGLIVWNESGGELTRAGLIAAAEVTRVHRLWELYLVEYADIAADHVDRDADDMEHLLPPELVDRLEAKLANQHRLPALTIPLVPQSPH